MRIKWMAAIAAACLVTAASSAFADTVTLKYTGSTGSSVTLSGGQTTTVYPYDFTVNGTTSATLMCISFNDHITTGESWSATETQLSSSSSNFDKEEAYLFSLITPTTSAATVADIQFADWYLSDTTSEPNVKAAAFYVSNSSAILSYVSAATTTGISQSNAFYQAFDLYTPANPNSYYTSANGYPDGVPQSFVGAGPAPTPEPGSLALLGTGLVGMGGIFRRRMRKA